MFAFRNGPLFSWVMKALFSKCFLSFSTKVLTWGKCEMVNDEYVEKAECVVRLPGSYNRPCCCLV